MFFKTLLVTSLLALSASAAPALALRDTAAAAAVTASSATRAFLTNCWANPGARSEIEFYNQYPKKFGSAAHKNNVAVVSPGINQIWEDGGSTTFGGDTFTWTITSPDVTVEPYGAEVGNANFAAAGSQFTLVRSSEQIIYQQDGYDCRVIYSAIQTNKA